LARFIEPHDPDDRQRCLQQQSSTDPGKRASADQGDGKVDWQLVAYGNTVHSFTDPSAGNDNSKGAAYNGWCWND
jgi:hypothetical protein